MVLDLRTAVNCLNELTETERKRCHIGIVRTDISGQLGMNHRQGDIVLYCDDGEKLIVETPMTQEQIAKQKRKGSLLRTYATTFNVPRGYIDEVLL